MIGIITKLKATPPAKPENSLVVNTITMKTNSPNTIEGNPVSTSFIKPETIESLDEDHSEKKMPAPTPIGMEIRAAKPTIVKDPTIAGAIPPPERFGAVGKWVRKPIFMAGAPSMKTSPSMSTKGTIARTAAAITAMVIILLTIFRHIEILGGLNFVITVAPLKS
jgi:hypothetical protein